MKSNAVIFIVFLFLVFCHSTSAVSGSTAPIKHRGHPVNHEEIIYHIFQRSFYDSNGDMQGDLNGIRLKLDYLQRLGVTAILLTPLYESVFYHNYFATDFKKIDPAYGTMHDYLSLIRELHRR